MEEVDDAELVVERIAALDLGKAGLEACVRIPHAHRPGRRMQELRSYGTTAQLLEMVGWLRHWGVERVVMESTSTYWKGVYYLLEAEGSAGWSTPARSKTCRGEPRRIAPTRYGWQGGRAGYVPGLARAPPRDPSTA